MKATYRLILSFFIAFLLTILPLPLWMHYSRPAWVLIVLVYGLIFLPNQVGVVYAFVVGLILDLLVSPVLGLHALIYTSIAFLILKTHWFVKALLPLQQSVLLGIVEIVILMSEHTLGVTWWSSLPIFTTAVCWLMVSPLLQYFQVREMSNVR